MVEVFPFRNIRWNLLRLALCEIVINLVKLEMSMFVVLE
jgi:hypothetical protein